MAVVADLLARKGSSIVSIAPHATVLEAVHLMNQHKVGALIVTASNRFMEQDGTCQQVIGMFTERDVLTRVIGSHRDAEATRVDAVMTSHVVFCKPQDELDEVAETMRSNRIRHVPVCDDEGRLLGLVSIGDLNAWRVQGQEDTIYYLNEYIQGRV